MHCPMCNAEAKQGARFCTACGTQLPATCRACGVANLPGDRFCAGCGAGLVAASVEALQPLASGLPPAPIAAHRRVGDGERKRVTVLFADLKGSTAAIEGLDPEAALNRIEPAVQIMIRLVHRYEGVVCRRLGDGILAIFGAPTAHEDHAVRACFSALGMQREMREAGMGEMLRVGLNSGDVLYRTISSELGSEVDVVGPVVHVAARMEQLATPGSVYMTGETQSLTQGLVETQAIGPREVKGASAPIEIYEATGALLHRSRWQASASRERAPFVGRDGERATLEAALAALDRRRGGVIGICGEAGLGKSRLVHSVVRDSDKESPHKTVFAAATALGRNIPYHALASALRDLIGIADSDDTQRISTILSTVLGELDPRLLADVPVFVSLISLAGATPEWLAMDPRGKRAAARDSFIRLARAAAARRPVAFVFEDMHWVDRDSEEVLRAVAELTREAPLLAVLTYRAEYNDSWLPAVGGTRLRMAPLGDDDVRRSLGEWFVEGPETEQLIERLTRRVGGNPLFVEECVRALAHQGALASIVVDGGSAQPRRRRYACWETPDLITVPPSVHDVIASRIDRRSPDCVALLQTLAMIGARVPLWLAERVSGLTPTRTEAALHEAVSAEILVQASLYPDVEYTFTHALLREVAHDSLTRTRRVEAHRRILSAIETHHADRLPEHAEWMAHHAAEGELWDVAATHQGHAAERALARGSYAEAIAGLRAALESFERSSRSRETTERAIDQLRLQRALLYATGGDPAEIKAALTLAEELARGIDDRVRLAWVWADQSSQSWVEGENGQAIGAARRSLDIAEEAADLRLRALALFRLGLGLYAVGDYVGAAESLGRSCDLLSGDLKAERIGTAGATSVLGGGYLVTTLCELGRYDEADHRLTQAIAAAAAARDIYSIAAAQIARCMLAIARGDVATAMPALEALLGAARTAGIVAVTIYLETLLGRAKFIAGDYAGAVELLSEKAETASVPRASLHGLTKIWLAEAKIAAGMAAEADAILEEAEREMTERGEAGSLAHCWATKGKAALMGGNLPAAEAAFARGLDQANILWMRPVADICKAGLAGVAAARQAAAPSATAAG